MFSSVDAFKRRRTPSDLKGRRHLLLTFFPRCFTGNCASQLTSLRDSYTALQKAGVEVWAVSTDPADGPQGQRAFSKHFKLPFPLLPDTGRKISLAYGAVQSKDQVAARMSVFIDKNGIVRWIDKQINPRTHGADVLARVQMAAEAIRPDAK
jgi:peroxiredoxin Q/BCP